MNALIVYDSFFGNTEKVAKEIGGGLDKNTRVVKVSDLTQEMLKGVDVLLVGSPTRAFSPTPAIRSFLAVLPKGSLQGVKAAAFDTRMDMSAVTSGFLKFMVKLFGFGVKAITKGLERAGCTLVVPAEGFVVNGTEGPLKDGELPRALAWGRAIRREIG